MAEDPYARIAEPEADLRQARALHAAEVAALLEQQIALGDVLRVIASSPTALSRVFETVAERASRLYGAASLAIWQVDGAFVSFCGDSGS